MKQAKINRKLAKRFLRLQVYDTYRVDNVIYYDNKLNKKKKESAAYDNLLFIAKTN